MDFFLEANTPVVVHGEKAHITSYNAGSGQISLKTVRGVDRLLDMNEFASLYQDEALIIGTGAIHETSGTANSTTDEILSLFTNDELEVIQYRLGFIKVATYEDSYTLLPTLERRASTVAHAMDIGAVPVPSDASITRWYRRYKISNRDVRSLLPRNRKKGNRSQRLTAKAEQLMREVIDRCYLTVQRHSIKHVYNYYLTPLFHKDEQVSMNDLPSLKTFGKRIRDLDEEEKTKKRMGYLRSRNEFPSGSKVSRAKFAQDLCEIDHTPLDITIVSSEGEVLGNPHLTCIIDSYSRMIVGFFVALHAPNKLSVIKALLNAILPKSYLAELYPEIVNEWPCFGIPCSVVSDNGQDLLAEDVKFAMAQLGIDYIQNKKKMPFMKGKIERFLKTVNHDFIHQLPGTTFSNYIHKDDYDSQMNACLTFEELDYLLHLYIVDEYHVREHRALNASPLSVWKKSRKNFEPPRFPASIKKLEDLMHERHERKLQKYGVEINNLKYNSVELMNIAKKDGFSTTLTVLVNPDDISSVRVQDPRSHNLIEVHCTNQAYVEEGLSLREHKRYKSKIKSDNSLEKAITDRQLIEARQKVIEVREKAEKRKSKGSRKKAPADSEERKQNSAKCSGAEKPKKASPVPMSDELINQQSQFTPMEFEEV